MSADEYRFRLFIAGNEPNSLLAEQNLRALCLTYLPGCHHIEIIDVLQDFEAALQAMIMVAPAVMMLAPRAVTLFGALNDTAKTLAALGLKQANPHD
ncbi:MAG: circadian clock KaiB family protein [Gallionella sp.]|nr:circadian clock KaiB family protein [Gallionella sp.]